MPKNRPYKAGGGVAQPGIEYGPEKNMNWPDPLVSPANPLKHVYTDGKSGSVEQKSVESVKISR